VALPRVLSRRYRLEQRLGRGGMGVVYGASDLSLDRSVAVKVLREELVGDRESASRFEREARISASFSHPNVVTVFDFGVIGDSRAFLVMERLEGTTLREEISRGPLERARVLSVMRGVCGAVDAAHRRQLVHRDLKPENVFLARSDGGESPKVLDFGIAKALAGSFSRADNQTTMGVVLGTRQYMAPEQLRGESPEPSWDLWALALVVHEMLTGYHPFASLAIGLTGGGIPTAKPMAVQDADPLPVAWQHAFARWLSIESAGRPATAGALFAELEEMLSRG
jgi:serine/threonine-protein kinase